MATSIQASAPSFYAKHGRGGFEELMVAARKVAGLEQGQVAYSPGFPEENVYHLITTLLEFEQAKSIDELAVVFVGNRVRKVELWSMKDTEADLAVLNGGQATKEFHCFLVQSPPPAEDGDESSSYVWDLDTTLPFPCRLGFYASHALRVQARYQLADKLTKQYRVVKAKHYLKHFASDRAHMKMADDTWTRPLPPWPAIVNAGGTTSTISKFFTFGGVLPTHVTPEELDSDYGAAMDETTLMQLFNVHMAC